MKSRHSHMQAKMDELKKGIHPEDSLDIEILKKQAEKEAIEQDEGVTDLTENAKISLSTNMDPSRLYCILNHNS